MKGFIAKTAAAACLACGLAAAGGCCSGGMCGLGGDMCFSPYNRGSYRDVVDVCWPERYEYVARQEILAAFGPQVHNGVVLDQTMWNWHFEAGTDKLTPGGMDHLLYLIRRRPCPNPTIYLATAQDIVYDQAAPEKFPEARCELDSKRTQAIQKYVTAQTAGRCQDFRVCVHDPAVVDISALEMANSIRQSYSAAIGALPTTQTFGATGPPIGGGGGR